MKLPDHSDADFMHAPITWDCIYRPTVPCDTSRLLDAADYTVMDYFNTLTFGWCYMQDHSVNNEKHQNHYMQNHPVYNQKRLYTGRSCIIWVICRTVLQIAEKTPKCFICRTVLPFWVIRSTVLHITSALIFNLWTLALTLSQNLTIQKYPIKPTITK